MTVGQTSIPYASLGSLTKIKTGKLDANASSLNGEYPFFTCAATPLSINTFSYECECILVAGNGDLNVKYYNGKFDAYQRTYIVESKDSNILLPRYLFRFLELHVAVLRIQAIGGVIKYIKLENLMEAQIPLPSIETQRKIAAILDKAQDLIDLRKAQLEKLDDFLRSVFLDMFGDPVTNPKGWEMPLIEEIVSKEKNAIKAGPFGSALKKEFYVISGYKIYGQEQVICNDANYGDYFIDEKKYKELENCAVKANDVLISLVGTYGKTLIIPKQFQAGIINPRLMKITFDRTIVNTTYFQFFFASKGLQNLLSRISRGGTMDILNLGIVKKIAIPIPPLPLQTQFAAIVEATEAQKALMQQSLIEMENNFNSLMQQAFRGELF